MIVKNLKGKEWLIFLLVVFSGIAQVILDVTIPDFMANLTSILQMDTVVIGDVVGEGSLMLGFSLLSLIIGILGAYGAAMISGLIAKRIRNQVFDKVMSFSLFEINSFGTASLITRCTNDVTQIQNVLVIVLVIAFKAPLSALLAFMKIAGKNIFWTITMGLIMLFIMVVSMIVLKRVMPLMTKQQYGHFIKCDTVENKLSRHRTEDIIFEHVPSLALLKYYKRFTNGEDTSGRFAQFLENVKSGKSKMNISTTTVYDIYKNRNQIDADLFFDQLEKISINALVIVDSSGSMQDDNDSYGKALSIGHYLTKCSSYMPGYFISFSSRPQLMQLQSGETYSFKRVHWGGRLTEYNNQPLEGKTKYQREINSMVTGDCTNTEFRAVCELLKSLDKENAPEWLVVLSDMEFDSGSNQSASEVQTMFREFGFNTNIIWWNLNARNTTTTFQKDQFGNVYLSGYSPMLLKYLESGFDGTAFLNKLLDEYAKKVKVA